MVRPRKIVLQQEIVTANGFGEPCAPVTRVAALAVFRNPLAGRFETDLSSLFDIGRTLGEDLASRAVALPERPAISYDKAAIVGVYGEMEHGGAVIHPRLGAPMRAAAGGGQAVIPSNVKVAPPGATIDLPMGHKDNSWSFDHFDAMTIGIADGPRPDEIVLCLANADGGRPLPRCGAGPVTA